MIFWKKKNGPVKTMAANDRASSKKELNAVQKVDKIHISLVISLRT